MTLRSQAVVQATVRDSRSFWTPDRKLILTSTVLDITDFLKGQTARTVQITTVGGQVGDTVLHVSGMPSFRSGENVIVFVERSGAHLTVVGLGQGKFTVANGEAANFVAGLNFADGATPRSTRMPLESFKNFIRSVAAGGKSR